MNQDLRIQAIQDAFDAYLLPTLQQDTAKKRAEGLVFYQGRWMSERRATRIHYLLKRDSERSFLDLLILDIFILAIFVAAVRFFPVIVTQVLN